MKKRILAILCIAALLAAMMAGCGAKEEAPVIKTPEISTITPSSSSGAQPAVEQPAQPPVQEGFTVNAYAAHWSDVRIWAWSANQENLFDQWPGESMHNDGNGWYSYQVPDWVDYVIINGNAGTAQTADLKIDAQDNWIIVFDDNSASVTYLDPAYVEDPWKDCDMIDPYGNVISEYGVSESGYIPELYGEWENVHLQDGSQKMNVVGMAYPETIYNCTQLTVNMAVEMNAGTSCKEWQLWGRSGGSFVKIAKVPLPAGNGQTSYAVTFDTPVSFDALVLTPTSLGGYSFSIDMWITDVFTN